MFRAFAPATVANAACGFDILGFAIEGWGDYVSIEPHTQNEIQVSGPYGSLIPTVWEKNTAAVAMQSLLHAFHREQECFRIHIEKNIFVYNKMLDEVALIPKKILMDSNLVSYIFCVFFLHYL